MVERLRHQAAPVGPKSVHWQHIVYTWLLFSLTGVLIVIAVLTWARRPRRDGRPLAILTIVIAWWTFAYGLQLAGADLDTKFLWARLKYASITSLPSLWIVFVLHFTGHERWLTRWVRVLLAVIPVIFFTLMWTTGHHHLMWQSMHLEQVENFVLVRASLGPAFWVYAVYTYAVFLGGLAFMTVTLRKQRPRPYRWQTGLIYFGLLFPLVCNLLYLVNIRPAHGIDPTPFAFALTSLAMANALVRFQNLELTPIACDELIAHITDPIIVINAHGQTVRLNPAAEGLTGTTSAAASGQPATALLDTLGIRLNGAVHLQQATVEDTLRVQVGDEERYFDPRLTLLYDKAGTLRGYLLMLHDITERRRSERLIRQYAEELEARNAELDAFTHTVAHNLKSPLNLILGYTSLILEECDPKVTPEKHAMLDTVRQTAKLMNGMINNLLRFAQIRDATETLVAVDMAQVAHAAVDRLQKAIADRQVTVTIAPDLPPAQAVAPWVEEVLAILIDNAIKYMGDDNPAPRVTVRGKVHSDGTLARYEVEDNGIGIVLEDIPRVFEPLTRLKEVKIEGHGMGLPIVKRIVTKLGGEVGVESTPGQGSTFWFTLPVAAPHPGGEETPVP